MWVRQPAKYKLSRHHNNGTGIGWSNHPENKTHITQGIHRPFHEIFDIMPPHLVIKYIIRLACKSLTEEVQQKIIDLLSPDEPLTLYKPETIKTRYLFKRACEKFLRVDYVNKEPWKWKSLSQQIEKEDCWSISIEVSKK